MDLKKLQFWKTNAIEAPVATSVEKLNIYSFAGQQAYAGSEYSLFDGGKFAGGFGATQLFEADYWTLRKRSAQLFNENLYAKGIVRRLITNEINTGLTPEASPDESIIGVKEDSLNDWTETIENRFGIWAKSPRLCDWKKKDTFGAIQREARREALITGDVLVVLRQSQVTRLPMVELISGENVQTPFGKEGKARAGHTIVHGVELDSAGRQVAYWVNQKDGTSKRIPAVGERSGRRISWLLYGTEKRMDEVRGQPLLSVVLQSLKEIDRYRDSTQRKAVVNSIIAAFIEKSQDKPGTLAIQKSATRNDAVAVTDPSGDERTFNIATQHPGMIIEELQTGEKPVLLGAQGTDTAFGVFEESIIQAVAWANEIPPEILTLAFSNNYSASQAAINEFKIYLNMIWSSFGETFCTPIYIEWLISETLMQKIKSQTLLESWRDPQKYDVFGSWVSVEWFGSIKPSTDMLKQAKGSKMLVEHGWSTNARESRGLNGSKFTKNIKRLTRENELKVKAMIPLAEFEKKYGPDVAEKSISALEDATAEFRSIIEENAGD